MSIHFLAVDGFNLIRRIFEARKPEDQSGLLSVVESTAASLRKALNRHSPTHAAVVLERHDRTWRHMLEPEYKANRSETPALLVDNLDAFREAFMALGVRCCEIDSYEADDVVATIARVVASHDGNAVILSTDKIYAQLLAPRIKIYDHFADAFQDDATVVQRFKVQPDQLVDYFAMAGDRTNNIKGISGIGPKAACRLLDAFVTLDNILAWTQLSEGAAELDSALRLAIDKVQKSETTALRCRQLVTLKTDVSLGLNLKSFRILTNQSIA
ncbi:MAG: protein Xni [Candidatus Azotimanducaceae bacterium]|jgi:protein Xni